MALIASMNWFDFMFEKLKNLKGKSTTSGNRGKYDRVAKGIKRYPSKAEATKAWRKRAQTAKKND